MMRGLSIKQLYVYKAVAETLNFHKAAESLYITQPAVTKHIKLIESFLEVQLFTKVGKKNFLTDTGRILFNETNKFLDNYEKFNQTIDQKVLDNKTISIAVIPALQDLIVDTMIDFVKKRPEIEIKLDVIPNYEMLKVMQQHEHDVYLTVDIPLNLHFKKNHLFSSPIYLMSSFAHPLANKKQLQLNDLSDEVFIEIDTLTHFKEEMEAFKRKYQMNTKKNNRIKIKGREALFKAVSANLGVSLLPWFIVKDYVLENKMKILDIEKNTFTANYSYYLNEIDHQKEYVINFLEMISLNAAALN